MKYVKTLVLALTMAFAMVVSNAAAEMVYGDVNIAAINTGNLQLKGVTWCKKYFESCIFKETWTGPIMNSRQTISAYQFVVMQTGITNPKIVDVDEVGGGKYRIIFVYDQNNEHSKWVPDYSEKDKK